MSSPGNLSTRQKAGNTSRGNQGQYHRPARKTRKRKTHQGGGTSQEHLACRSI